MEKKLLKALYYSKKDTPLKIGQIEIPCWTLEDGTAVISGRGIQKMLGYGSQRSGVSLKKLIKSDEFSKFVSPELTYAIENPIPFIRIGSGGSQPKTHGYEATILIDYCYVLIDAKNDKVPLSKTQILLVTQAEIIVRAFSKTGIVAVIHKLTGYLDKQVETYLNDILNKYLYDAAKKYIITYPIELYKEWFRLNNWEWRPENKQKRPSCLGSWTNEYIYARLGPGILKELKTRNPKNEKGYREHKHFQFLTDDIGEPKLREFFGGLIALAKATSKWRNYTHMVNKAYPKYGETITIPLEFEENE
jgi:hypothetical protein